MLFIEMDLISINLIILLWFADQYILKVCLIGIIILDFLQKMCTWAIFIQNLFVWFNHKMSNLK